MNDQSTATNTKDYDEDDLLGAAIEDASEVPEKFKHWFPEDYVVAILGHRRSGKTSLMARCLLSGLANNLRIYTNLELYPEKLNLNIDEAHKPLKLDNLLTFDPSISQAVIGIEEIGTWMEAMRSMSTTNIILSKFFQLFIGKQSLRIFFTNQSPRLPSWMWEQIDLVIYAHDLFYTEWGREANLAKGTNFYYVAYDKSGIFTGHSGTTWAFGLRKANRLWPLFNSYQMFDPYQWARKTKIVGAESVLDLDSGEMYGAGEEDLRAWQTDLKANSIVLNKILGAYESTGFLDLAKKYKAIQDLPDRMVFSVDGLRKALVNVKGKKRQDAEETYEELRTLAGQGQIARFGPRHEIIELAKPITEGNYEE